MNNDALRGIDPGTVLQPAAAVMVRPGAVIPTPAPTPPPPPPPQPAPAPEPIVEPPLVDMRGRPIRAKAAPVVLPKASFGQVVASLGASFLPIASYQLAHVEAVTRPYLWFLVGAALLFSAPSVAAWAHTWTSKDPDAFPAKAWGFAILLEGVLILAATEWLSFGGLAILVLTNATAAWAGYAHFKRREAQGDE